MSRSRRLALPALAFAALLLAAPARAYYHYVHFLTGAPFTPAYEKFDLAALLDKTVSVYVSDAGARPAGTDSFASVLSQVKAAAGVWNSVSRSDLRVAFGGIRPKEETDNTPGILVEFGELPPGVLAEAAPTVASSPVAGQDGPFFPIVGSVVLLNSDISAAPGPSYAESYFTTTVHEMGHALGLQHTFTAGAMSQGVIRDTWRTAPLGPDDKAAFGVLYGKPGWTERFGSISGRVTSNGEGVGLASVVALPVVGSPVSALTDPDGSYRIVGLPPGQYLLYVHPLPPDADVTAPKDASGNPFAASQPFGTVFFPSADTPGAGTRDPARAIPAAVRAGTAVTGLNVEVAPRAAVPTYDVVTFSYFDPAIQTYSYLGTPVTPAFINSAQSLTKGFATFVIQSATGVTPVPQSADILGAFTNVSARSCCDSQAVALDFYLPFYVMSGPRHLILNYGDDVYVLPNAVNMVLQDPPALSGITANSDGSVTVAGANLNSRSRIFFDGLEADIRNPFDLQSDSITVFPPPGFGGQKSSVVAYSPDGQSSMTLNSVALAYGNPLPVPPPVYEYPAAGAPQVSVTPQTLPVGAFAKVEVNAANMTFRPGQVTLGFGTDDVLVRRIWVLSPTQLVADVIVSPHAAMQASEISVVSGFQVATLPNAFQIVPADPAKPLITNVANATPTQATFYPGASVTVFGSNLSISEGAARVTLNGAPVPVAFSSSGQVTFVVPADFPFGPATLVLNNGSADSLPLTLAMVPPPPSILGVSFIGQPLTDRNPALPGDYLDVRVTGLDPEAAADLTRFGATLGALDEKVVAVIPEGQGVFRVLVLVAQVPAGTQAPLAIWMDGSSSASYPVPVSQNPAPLQ